MKYLVDSNVLSEATRKDPDAGVVSWLRANEPRFCVDPIILGELKFGILMLAPGKRRKALEAWFAQGVGKIECLKWTSDTGIVWAELLLRLRQQGRGLPLKDSMIAASAMSNGLIMVTRNVDDFSPCGVEILNPFTEFQADSARVSQK